MIYLCRVESQRSQTFFRLRKSFRLKKMASRGSAKAVPGIEYFGFLENGIRTQDSYRLSQKAFADRLVRAAAEKGDYSVAVPTPSGMALELIDNRLALRLVEDWLF